MKPKRKRCCYCKQMKDMRFTRFLYKYRQSNLQAGIRAKKYAFCSGCIGMFMREAVFEMYNDLLPF